MLVTIGGNGLAADISTVSRSTWWLLDYGKRNTDRRKGTAPVAARERALQVSQCDTEIKDGLARHLHLGDEHGLTERPQRALFGLEAIANAVGNHLADHADM